MRLFIEAEADGVTRQWIEEFRDEARARDQVSKRGFVVRVVREATADEAQEIAAQQQTPSVPAEPAGKRSKPFPWYLCLAAMWLCLFAVAWCVYQAAPETDALDNIRRVTSGLPPLRTSWNVLLLIAAGNSLFGAFIFGTLAAIVRRVDVLARKAT